ncbi:MAG: S-methyl-5'-thioadenosine phosphorylase [archaeon]
MRIGIIGGSGLDDPSILQDAKDKDVTTPFGKPSSPLKIGTIAGKSVVLLARHGRQHTITPSHVNYRANVHALKQEGCTHILATTAVGSLREHIGRGDMVIPDQLIDFTHLRNNSFFDQFEPNSPVHVSLAEPFSAALRAVLIEQAKALQMHYHDKATLITIEGPRFSTRAESNLFRMWGADIINMSIATEAALVREAGIPYSVIAMSTDYDCWKEDEEPVSWEAVLKTFSENVEKVTRLLISTIPAIEDKKTIGEKK